MILFVHVLKIRSPIKLYIVAFKSFEGHKQLEENHNRITKILRMDMTQTILNISTSTFITIITFVCYFMLLDCSFKIKILEFHLLVLNFRFGCKSS